MVRLEKRYSSGVQFLGSYVFSKLMTDADSYWSDSYGFAMDHYNRGLEKSIGAFDVTHNFKFSAVVDLPFGKGKKFLNKGGVVELDRRRLARFRASPLTQADSPRPSAPPTGCRCSPAATGPSSTRTTGGGRRPRATSSIPPSTGLFSPPASSRLSPPTCSAT